MAKGAKPGHLEREQKLAAWSGFELPELDHVVDGVVAVTLPAQQLDATYYDTPDLRLARAGITVRFRTGEDRVGKWTVKLPEGDRGPSLVRREIDVRAPARRVPDEVASLVRATVRSAPLAPVGTLSSHRHRVELRDGRRDVALAEVVDDEVSVLDGRTVTSRFRELEVELTDDGRPALLRAVVARLLEAGAVAGDQTPKIVRALGARALEPPDVVVAALDPDEATLADVVATAIAAGVARLVRHDPGVRLGGDDEDVHQARVAARRLRSDLRTFRSIVDPERAGALREELRWLGGELGVVRDADVLLDRLRAQAATLPATDTRPATALLRRLEGERDAARAALRRAYDGGRYVRLLDDLAAAAVAPPVGEAAGVRARGAVADLVRGPWKHLAHAVEALDDPPADEALHDLRIRAKRVRYAAEAAAPIAGKPPLRFAKAAARLQTVLGDLQDAVVAEAWLRGAAARGPGTQALVAGELVAVQHAAMAAARRAWPDAWAALDDKKLRAWLR
jgi:CHAD domain-containing protein